MSEEAAKYGIHKYKVGDKFDFNGIVEILNLVKLSDESGDKPQYYVRTPDNQRILVSENWIDAGIEHFSQENPQYGVSYIASAPEDFKVGDRVEVVAAPLVFSYNIGRVGVITSFDANGNAYISVKDDDPCTITAPTKYLRKLPDTINFDNDSPLDKQIGGDHYKKCKIQPVDYIHANGLDFFQGNIVKYITRFRDKGGKQDLEKIKHYCDMLIELEYPDQPENL